jgi:hypothetical protein
MKQFKNRDQDSFGRDITLPAGNGGANETTPRKFNTWREDIIASKRAEPSLMACAR